MLIKENSSILIPIDFSKQSLIAIEQSYNLAKFTHSKIIVMHASPNSNSEHQKDLEEIVANIKKDAGLEAEFLNLKGDIYELIDPKAEEIGCALIVIGFAVTFLTSKSVDHEKKSQADLAQIELKYSQFKENSAIGEK